MNEKIIDYGYGLKTTQSFVDDVVDFVGGAAETLIKKGYTGTFMVGHMYGEWWDGYSKYKRQLIGRIVGVMVRKRVLPMKFTGSPKTKPRRYLAVPINK